MSADATQEKAPHLRDENKLGAHLASRPDPPPIPDAQREAERLLTKWREREVALCQRADGQSSTQYAMRIGAAAEEIANMMIDFEPVVTALAADCERLQQENARLKAVGNQNAYVGVHENQRANELVAQLTASQQEVTRLTAALTTLRDEVEKEDWVLFGDLARVKVQRWADTLTHLLTGETK